MHFDIIKNVGNIFVCDPVQECEIVTIKNSLGEDNP